MYDAWAAFDPIANGSFVHEKYLGGAAARDEAISYAAYRRRPLATRRLRLAIGSRSRLLTER